MSTRGGVAAEAVGRGKAMQPTAKRQRPPDALGDEMKQYEAEIKEGLMARTSLGEAIYRYGHNLIIAGTRAIAKKGTGPDGEVRVIYDGTNGIFLIYGIKIRDQVQFPGAPDIKAELAEMHDEGGSHVSILFDVSKAHRRVKNRRRDRALQACQLAEGDVLLNKVGTLDIRSAAY